MQKLSEADLIINPDGSIYHLNLLPEDLADTVITVGDLDRVGEISKHFDSIELKKGKREFITHKMCIRDRFNKVQLAVFTLGFCGFWCN